MRVRRRTELALLLVVLAIGAALRLLRPGADVPARAELTDAPVQDALWYLEAAAGPAEGLPRDLEPITAYDPPVWVHAARVWFACAGVSLGTAQALGALVSLATTLLVWRLARAALGPVEGLIAAAVLSTLYPFVWLSRTTLVYGPAALALTVAAALAWAGGRPAPRGRGALEGAAWLSLALCAWTMLELAGAPAAARALAVVLAAGLFAAWWRTRRTHPELAWGLVTWSAAWAVALTAPLALRPPAAAGIGALVALHVAQARRPLTTFTLAATGLAATLALLALLDPAQLRAQTLDRLERYVLRPDALAPAELAARVLRLGGAPVGTTGSGWVPAAGAASLAAALGVLTLVGRPARDPRRRDLVALVGGWAALFLVGAVASQYRPLRYFVVLGPPLAVFAAVGVGHLLRRPAATPSPRLPLAAALWGAFVAPHALEVLAGPRRLDDLVPAAAAGAAAALGLRALSPRLGPGLRRACATAVLIGATAPGALSVALDLARPDRSMLQANRAAAAALAPGASLVGPHASVLALGHGIERRRAPWIDVSPARAAATIERLRQVGATHLALGIEQAASSGILDVLEAHGVRPTLVGIFLPRGTPVLLLRFPWAVERGYVLSPFERRRDGDRLGEPPAAEADSGLLLARVRALAFEGAPDQAARVVSATAAQPSVPEDLLEIARRTIGARGLR